VPGARRAGGFLVVHSISPGHFDQAGRNDLEHLRVCLEAANCFLAELVQQREVRMVLTNMERLLALHGWKPTGRLETEHQFSILSAIPIENIRDAARDEMVPLEDRKRLERFCSLRWPQAEAKRRG
jgi:hypothetical protein